MNKRLRKKLRVAEFAQTGVVLTWNFIKGNEDFFDGVFDALDVIPTMDFAGFSDNEDGGWLHIWHSARYGKFTNKQREIVGDVVRELMLKEYKFIGWVDISEIKKL